MLPSSAIALPASHGGDRTAPKGPILPKIQTVEFCAVSLPLDRATAFSNRTVSARHYGRVMLHQSPGLGLGFDAASVQKYGRWSRVGH